MRTRPSARLLIVDNAGRLLLFRYTHSADALTGRSYWATPGGGVEKDESYEQAAIRELQEETGIVREDVGVSVAVRKFVMKLPDGETVKAQERYYVVRVDDNELSRESWSCSEKQIISECRWWSAEELSVTDDVVFPANIVDMLANVIGQGVE
ncbi:NUDIX hydrolase [Dryocola clanedunensis]|uniref:NUDIX hydrolase n=1 Tax=Cedecea sulfonylureivorans TaxID=3051154 RepID=UPI00192539C4|nr:NUDIX domain-containing protein [Cedecea sulfonylureivorans]